MKLTLYAICAMGLLLGGVGCSTGGGQGTAPAVVTVEYLNPGSFSDFSVRGRDVQQTRAAIAPVALIDRRHPIFLNA